MEQTALDRVRPKTKTDKYLDNLVSGHYKTMKDAAKAAGFAESSLQKTIYRIARSGPFLDKLTKKTRKRTDIALRIAGRAGEHLEKALEQPDADPVLVLAAWRESTKIVREHNLTQDDLISPQRRRWYAMRRYKLALRMLKLGMSLSPRAQSILTMLNTKLGLAEPIQIEHD